MSDPPPPATTPVAGEPATTSAGQPPGSPTDSEKTIKAPEQGRNGRQEFLPASGLAIFSTKLCTLPQRQAPRPPYSPRIVHGSGTTKAVVYAARIWQSKFKWQCLCILPGQNWTIHDLWDAADIHLESAPFCYEMLTFISRDTYCAAKKFAEDWLRAHPDRLDMIGGDMMGVYDPNSPFALVDKIFTYGELIDFPRTFLWHVAHMMRTEVISARMVANEADRVRMEQEGGSKAALGVATTETEAVLMAETPSTRTDDSTDSAPSKRKKNRKASRSRPRKLTASTEESSTVTPAVPTAAPHQPAPRPAPARIPSQGPPQPGQSTDPMGSVVGGPRAMRVNSRPRNMGSGSNNQIQPYQGWGEQLVRVPTGPQSLSNMYPPPFYQATTAMGQPFFIQPNAMLPYPQGVSIMPPHMAPIPHFDPVMAQRGAMPGQAMPMQVPPMGQPYIHQAQHQAQQTIGARAGSMGDITNSVYYQNNPSGQSMDTRASMPRQASGSNAGGMLYDPYNGTNPRFNEAVVYSGGRKSSQSSFTAQSGPPRKTSNSGSRPGYGQYGADRPGNIPTSGGRYSEYGFKRGRSEDDPAITQNRSSGCHDHWIGPKNETVTELFVGDLPDDVQVQELQQLFEQQVDVSPSQVDIKHAHEHQYQQHQRLHAFISFSSASDAKKALQVRDRKPYLRDGSVSVAVCVPRRFFQKTPNFVGRGSVTSGSHIGPSSASKPEERVARGVTRVASHDENATTNSRAAGKKPLYSPQDARSDLHKKTVENSDLKDPATTGSPQAGKSKRDQDSPSQKATTEREVTLETDAPVGPNAAESIADVETHRTSPVEAEGMAAQSEARAAEEPSKTLVNPLEPATADTSIPEETSTPLTDTPSLVGNTADAAGEASSPPHQSRDTKSEHDREMPQTQTILETSPVEKGAPVVHIPVEPQGGALKAEKLATEATEATEATKVDVDVEEPPAASSCPASTEDVGSDDDVKNDISFHSARESQIDPEHVEPKTEDQDEAALANQGTATSIASSTKDSTKPAPSSSPRVTTEDAVQQHAQSPPLQPEQELNTKTATEIKPKNDTETAAPIQETVAEPAQNVTPMDEAPALPAAEGSKKGSTQQEESFFPFAKRNKNQLKKEKEARKKQQKKEQAEREAKAKAEKATSSAKLNEPTTTEAETEQPRSSSNTPEQTDSRAKTTGSDHTTMGKPVKASKGAKGKGKAPVGATADQETKAKSDSGGEETGKPTGELQIPKEKSTTKSSPIPGAPDVPSPDTVRVDVADRQIDPPHDTQTASNKKKNPIPAVPKLRLPPSKPSAHSEGSRLNVTGASDASSSSTTGNIPPAPEHDLAHPHEAPNPAPVSSSTNQPREEGAAMTPSSPAPGSSSALQTTGTPVPPQGDDIQANSPPAAATPVGSPEAEAPKKKKKKTKKKSKKTDPASGEASTRTPEPVQATRPTGVANPDSDSGTDEDYHSYDPFSSQFTHIDAIRRGLKNPNSYFARVNAQMEAQEKEKAEAKEGVAEKKSESALRHIADYLRENPRFLTDIS